MTARENLLKLVLAFSKASNEFRFLNKKKVAIVGINKEKGWLYYVDEEGDISKTKASRGRKKASKKNPVKKSSKKKQLLMNRIKLLEKKYSSIKTKNKDHYELKDKIKILKNNLKKLK